MIGEAADDSHAGMTGGKLTGALRRRFAREGVAKKTSNQPIRQYQRV